MTSFEDFTLYYAKSLADNTPVLATLKIVGGANNIKLVYCIPIEFTKRQTDTSNALSEDITSPDTGTARAGVEIEFTQERASAPTTNVLVTLLDMFYKKTEDDIFRKARFGLSNTDNPSLDALPIATGGYKFISFRQMPNRDNPALNTYIIRLDFIGDHTILGAFS